MTQEEKQLLLKDLCGRLRYGVRIHINSSIEEQNRMQLYDVNLESETIGVSNEKWTFRAIPIIDEDDDTKIIKPYLRPMSSMTEEECKELGDLPATFEGIGEVIPNVPYYIEVTRPEQIDWLNENHFDYRGLISMGLAIEAPEGMYKTE